MIRSAVLVSGKGTKLQSLLDSVFFGEIPELQLVAVISSNANAYALKRARNAGIETVVVEPAMFPNDTSYDMAIRNKLKDMDIDLVIVADYDMPLGVISTQFRKRIIGVYPSLIPAFVNCDDSPVRAAMERGCKVTGATAFFADIDGNIGPIIAQQAIDIDPEDTLQSLNQRIMEEAAWKLLPKAVALFCQGRLEIHGERVVIKPE